VANQIEYAFPGQGSAFGLRLRWARDLAGVTQVDLARQVGCGQALISKLERQKTKGSGKTAELAHWLGVDAYWLATGEGGPLRLPL
jgi:transcriptional regulator with XRE-family HTH domain